MSGREDEFDFDVEDLTGSCGLPDDDPDFKDFVRLRDLVSTSAGVELEIRHFEEAVGPTAFPYPLPLEAPPVLRWLRLSGLIDEWRNQPTCLRCGVQSGPSSFRRWGERGVICSFCEATWKRDEIELHRALGGRSWVHDMIERLGELAASPSGRALERLNRSMSPGRRGPKKGSHRDPQLVERVIAQEADDPRGTRSVLAKAELAATSPNTYRQVLRRLGESRRNLKK